MTDEQLSLRLIGYYRCAGHGFAMPLYGQTEGANTLYIAQCSISGDHHAKIEHFQPVDVDDQRRLPHGESLAVSIGDAWRDVFVWNGAAYVGTPEELWAELTPFHSDVEARAPLSLLDLAVHARPDEVGRLAPVALAFLRRRFSDAHARSWRRQFVRQLAEVAFRQAMADQQQNDTLFHGMSLIEPAPNVLTFDLSAALTTSAALSRDAVELSISRVIEIAALLGASLALVLENVAPANVLAESTANVVPATVSDQSPHDDSSVLVIAQGKRAREVVSHLRSGRERDMIAMDKNLEIISTSGTMSSIPQETPVRSTIVLVLGEDEKGLANILPTLEPFLERQARAGALILLAPALPPSRPSMLFDDLNISGGPVRAVHAVLDTAIARSPFWWGKAKRSFDRRISDVLHAAIAAARSPVVRRELFEQRQVFVPILSIGVIPRSGEKEALFDEPSNLRLGSEVSWVAGDPKRSDPAVLFSVRINPDEFDNLSYDAQLIVEGRKPENRFPEFASSVLAPIFSRRHRRPLGAERRIEQLPHLPDGAGQALRSPDYAGAFAIGYATGDKFNLLVTGEAPTLDAVEQAGRVGWRIARYTDSSTLRKLSEDVDAPTTFPDEIDLGSIRSHELNRRLATRGVDQRDIIRISYDLMSEWLDILPASKRAAARRFARPLRSAARPFGEPEHDHLLMRDYVFGSDPAARSLLSLITSQGRKSLDSRPMKRSADLVKCWTPPSPGFQRYALVDGAVPIILMEMRDNEVPVEDLFLIDGDQAVPILFRSRVFAVWARATLPAASSWMARFSVANTFGGFPVVEPFRMVGQEDGLTALVADGGPAFMGELAEEIGQHIERALASQPAGSWKEAYRVNDELPAMRRLNELVLNAYDLPGDADDIRILRRLLEMNAAFD